MTTLIEQATRRLEQLRNAGVDIPVSSEGGAEPIAAEQPLRRIAPAALKTVDSRQSVTVPKPAMPAAARQSVTAPKPAMPTAAPPSPKLSQEAPRPPRLEKSHSHHVSKRSHASQTPELSPSCQVKIDFKVLDASGIICPNAPRSRQADEYRVIKRPLIDNAMGKGAARVKDGNLIMVTSALPGEGKTYSALNLAMSIAMELDNTVMLVDADVARPSLLARMGLTPTKGLLDVLVDANVSLSQVLLRTNIEKLTLLPSGTQHPRATELLASDAMVLLLEEMSSRYADRIIIFDSPPLLVTTEARTLASHMGQVIMVVAAERTTLSEVRNALAAIETCPVRLMLLNQAKIISRDEYGYGYGYGYGNAA